MAGRADAQIRAAKLLLDVTVATAYAAAEASFRIFFDLRVSLHQTNVYVVQESLEIVRSLFAEMGTAGVFKGRRDIPVAAQHMIVGEHSYDRVGQFLLTRGLADGPEVEDGFIQAPSPRVVRTLRDENRKATAEAGVVTGQ